MRAERTQHPDRAFRLDGRLAVVTGAASGIGRATALLLVDSGARVIAADCDADGLSALGDADPSVTACTCDLASRQGVEALAEFVAGKGEPDIWINVAGTGALTPIATVQEPQFDRVMAINMTGAYWCCAAAARIMSDGPGKTIVNVSSNAADEPIAGLSAYAMSKAALNMLTRTLAVELGPRGIRVNAVAPGFTVTPMTADPNLDVTERDAVIARNAGRSPLGMVGTPDDIAYAILYLTAPASRFVTGQILRVNGGVTMP